MKRFLVALALALLAPFALAAPFLQTSAAYPFAANIPQSAYAFTAQATPGPFSLPCTVAAGIPKCDAAAAIAANAPLLNFVMTVTLTAGCDATGANCWSGGTAASTPFVRTTSAPTVGAPTGLLLGP